MESLSRLVSESLARHGFDRPLDYRRLQWSRWFRCESHRSLLVVPSKPGVFAFAEEIMDIGTAAAHVETADMGIAGPEAAHVGAADPRTAHVAKAASAVPRTRSEAQGSGPGANARSQTHDSRRMLAVTHFFEADDMAFTLDRMLSHQNPMQARLASGRYFVRFVEIHDQSQRRSICNALNQWIVSSAEKATGIGPHFASSLELTSDSVGRVAAEIAAAQPHSLKPNNESIAMQFASGLQQANLKHPAKNVAPEAVAANTVERAPLFPSGF